MAPIMSATAEQLQFIKESIRTIPDYPKEGVLFRDITTLLANPEAYRLTIDMLVEHFADKGITKVVGTEARGFLFGAPVALRLGVGFVPVRKKGKLPCDTLSETYDLEYGTDTLEMHKDSISSGDNVLVVDDLLATGGTALAACRLAEQLGGKVVAVRFAIELEGMGGREKLRDYDVDAVMTFPGD